MKQNPNSPAKKSRQSSSRPATVWVKPKPKPAINFKQNPTYIPNQTFIMSSTATYPLCRRTPRKRRSKRKKAQEWDSPVVGDNCRWLQNLSDKALHGDGDGGGVDFLKEVGSMSVDTALNSGTRMSVSSVLKRKKIGRFQDQNERVLHQWEETSMIKARIEALQKSLIFGIGIDFHDPPPPESNLESCMVILNRMEGLDGLLYTTACVHLRETVNRRMFASMPDDTRRLWWILSLPTPIPKPPEKRATAFPSKAHDPYPVNYAANHDYMYGSPYAYGYGGFGAARNAGYQPNVQNGDWFPQHEGSVGGGNYEWACWVEGKDRGVSRDDYWVEYQVHQSN